MGDIADMYDYDFDPWDLAEDLPAKCRYCGARIQWKKHDDKWRVYTETGKRHICKPFLKTVRSTPEEDFA
jgi:DNA-directed RNA polymerase subunit RPC12/RpoP